MQVICLQEDAFYELLDKVVERIKEKHNIKEDKWISGEEAMRKLRIPAAPPCKTSIRILLPRHRVPGSLANTVLLQVTRFNKNIKLFFHRIPVGLC